MTETNCELNQETEEWSRDSDNQLLSNLAQTNLNSASAGKNGEEPQAHANDIVPNADNGSEKSPTPAKAKSKNEEKKIFVGGISWDTNEEDMKNFFSQFGEVAHVQIKFDHFTGRSRGFAFVEFGTSDACQKALNNKDYELKGKKIEIKPAKSRENKKIFVGGLPGDFTEEELRKHFDQYGKIEEIEWPFDKFQNKRKIFAFIVFEDEEATQKAAVQSKQKFGDRMCDVKIAVPQYMRPQRQFGNMPMAPAAYGTGWNDFAGYGAYGAGGASSAYVGGYGAGVGGGAALGGPTGAAGGGYYDDYYAAAAAAAAGGHHGAAGGAYGGGVGGPNDYASQHGAAAAGSYDYTGWQAGAAAGGYDGWNYGGVNPGAAAGGQGTPGRPGRGGYSGYGGY